ncbi:hypothetical protein D9M68_400450 [compost metagenome]
MALLVDVVEVERIDQSCLDEGGSRRFGTATDRSAGGGCDLAVRPQHLQHASHRQLMPSEQAAKRVQEAELGLVDDVAGNASEGFLGDIAAERLRDKSGHIWCPITRGWRLEVHFQGGVVYVLLEEIGAPKVCTGELQEELQRSPRLQPR